MEAIKKSKINVIITVALSVGLLVSVGVNVSLYSQFSPTIHSAKAIQLQHSNVQSEYESISLEIEAGKHYELTRRL